MSRKELGIYVHIPFCVRKCAYCDFLSFPAGDETRSSYFTALRKEIASFDRAEEYEAVSIYFGGGTPSLPSSGEITKTLEEIRRTFFVSADAEITIECNPGTMDRERLADYHAAGIDRLSIGLQSADNRLLETLGRIHTWETFEREFHEARSAGFDNISIDLMYGLPGQSLSSWEDTVNKVTALRPEHLSAYSLIIEEGTPFWERYNEDAEIKKRGEQPLFLPDEETEDRMLLMLEDSLRNIDMYRYEISNYARPGRESRHNTGYWLRREYAGFGLGASSQIGKTRYRNTAILSDYTGIIQKDNCISEEAEGQHKKNNLNEDGLRGYNGKKEDGSRKETDKQKEDRTRKERESVHISNDKKRFREEMTFLTREDEISETIILGLRMTRGVDLDRFEETFSVRAEDLFSEEIQEFRQEGLLELTDHHLRLTDRGLDVSNLVMSSFV